jgi:hypothetical protein
MGGRDEPHASCKPEDGTLLATMKMSAIVFLLLSLQPALPQQHTSTSVLMQNLLPSSIRQWHSSEAPRSYPGTHIFEYMDGAGEVYRAYDFRDLIVQRYTRPNQEEILVELFDMGSSRNAFGVFTYMQGRGPAVRIGQDGEYKSGLLCFWKGKYFVYAKIENENEEATKGVLDLGKAISDAIREKGERPALLRYLPVSAYLPGTLRFFFNHDILNAHYSIGDGNPLHLNNQTDGLLVRLKRDRSYLLLLGYPTREQTDSAYASFSERSIPETEEICSVREANGKWTACIRRNRHLVIVCDAPTRKRALSVLEQFRRRLP